MSKETLCWRCQNFSKCSWSRGVPVKDWDATPTIIKNWSGDGYVKTKSYIVNACPQFVCDVVGVRTSIEAMAEILGISERTVFRWVLGNKVKIINEMKKKGYKLTIYKPNIRNYYYLSKIGGENESN